VRERDSTTALLDRLRRGEPGAAEELLPRIYEQLREVAQREMGSERPEHTLQPTALVHEAWMRLSNGSGDEPFEDRAHFVAIAASAMRRVLVDHARRRGAQKRGAGLERMPLDEIVSEIEKQAHDLLALDVALEKLSARDGELARIVELRFFAGLTVEETGRVLGLSAPTVQRRWRTARAWLRGELLPD
jgi:RNA polymerase sigma factor (TIGR02999 family)